MLLLWNKKSEYNIIYLIKSSKPLLKRTKRHESKDENHLLRIKAVIETLALVTTQKYDYNPKCCNSVTESHQLDSKNLKNCLGCFLELKIKVEGILKFTIAPFFYCSLKHKYFFFIEIKNKTFIRWLKFLMLFEDVSIGCAEGTLYTDQIKPVDIFPAFRGLLPQKKNPSKNLKTFFSAGTYI
jgi:hypothetical protein